MNKLLLRAGLVLILIGAWYSLARTPFDREAPLVVYLVDVSASSQLGVGSRSELNQWLANQVRAVGGEEVAVLGFSSSAEWICSGTDASGARQETHRWLRARSDLGGGSAVDGALAMAEELVGERGLARVVLLGDGSFGGRDPGTRLAGMLGRGIGFEVLEPPRTFADVALARFDLGPRFSAGSPVAASFELVMTPANSGSRIGAGRRVVLDVSVTGGGQTRRFLWPEEGSLDLSVKQPRLVGNLPLGEFEVGAVEVSVRLAPMDSFGANERARRRFVVGPLGRVLVVASEDGRERAEAFFEDKLGGLGVSFASLAELRGSLNEVDVLVTWDLAPSHLPGPLLAGHVQRGMGWLALGSWGMLQDPLDMDPVLKRLLPMRMDDEGVPPRKVILCVDGSGSMEGAPFEAVQQAAAVLIDAAPVRDEVSLVFFTDGLGAPWRIRPALSGPLAPPEGRPTEAQLEAEMVELMRVDVPGGNTAILDAMLSLASSRRRDHGVPGMVILLSDGAENGVDFEDPFSMEEAVRVANTVRDRLIMTQTELAVISVLDGARNPAETGAARRLLEGFLAPGGKLYEVGLEGAGPELGELFARAVGGSLIETGRLDMELGSDPLAETLAPVGVSVGTLGRYRMSGGGQVLASVRSEAGELLPLLAVRRTAGVVAMLATEPGSNWAPTWKTATSLAPLLRWLAASQVDRAPGVWLGPRGLEASVDPDLFGKSGLPAELELGLRGAKGIKRVNLGLQATGGARAQFRGQLPTGWDVSQAIDVDLINPDALHGALVLATVAVDLPGLDPEGKPDRPRLFVDATMGESAGRPPMGAHPLASWLLAAGLLLVFGGLVVQRS